MRFRWLWIGLPLLGMIMTSGCGDEDGPAQEPPVDDPDVGDIDPGTCRKICCSADDCDTGQECTPVYPRLGTAGLCSGSGGWGQDAGGSETDGGLPPECWTGTRTCNPITNEGCDPGEACVFGDGDPDPLLDCFPAPDNAGPGEACDNVQGPFCAPGYHCAP
jgi:hypothetical protein